jgi:cytochrome c-L
MKQLHTKQMKLSAVVGLMLLGSMMLGLVACDKTKTAAGAGTDAVTATAESPAAAPAASGNAITFVSTQDDKPFVIEPALFVTPAAKEFLATGKNSYIGNEEAIAKGKRVFGLYSCTQCHGPEGRGQVGPGLVGPTFHYPKNATNKGMFETVWHGTNGGMGAKGIGLMDPTDAKNGITTDELLQVIAWIRTKGDGLTGNE